MNSIIAKNLNKLNYEGRFTDTQIELINYSILCIWTDLSKFVILFLLFSLLHYPNEFIYAFVTTSLLRTLSGGKHFKTYIRCLSFSFIYFISLIMLSKFIFESYTEYLIIGCILSSIILMMIAPQIPIHSRRILKSNPIHLKIIIMIIEITYNALFLVLKEPMFIIGLLAIIFQTILLLNLKGENYREYNKKEETY